MYFLGKVMYSLLWVLLAVLVFDSSQIWKIENPHPRFFILPMNSKMNTTFTILPDTDPTDTVGSGGLSQRSVTPHSKLGSIGEENSANASISVCRRKTDMSSWVKDKMDSVVRVGIKCVKDLRSMNISATNNSPTILLPRVIVGIEQLSPSECKPEQINERLSTLVKPPALFKYQKQILKLTTTDEFNRFKISAMDLNASCHDELNKLTGKFHTAVLDAISDGQADIVQIAAADAAINNIQTEIKSLKVQVAMVETNVGTTGEATKAAVEAKCNALLTCFIVEMNHFKQQLSGELAKEFLAIVNQMDRNGAKIDAIGAQIDAHGAKIDAHGVQMAAFRAGMVALSTNAEATAKERHVDLRSGIEENANVTKSESRKVRVQASKNHMQTLQNVRKGSNKTSHGITSLNDKIDGLIEALRLKNGEIKRLRNEHGDVVEREREQVLHVVQEMEALKEQLKCAATTIEGLRVSNVTELAQHSTAIGVERAKVARLEKKVISSETAHLLNIAAERLRHSSAVNGFSVAFTAFVHDYFQPEE